MSWRRWAGVTAVLTLALLAMVADKQYTLRTGQEVRLRLQLRDPRDLFRGDYVALNYRIATLMPAHLEGDVLFDERDTIYVRLEPEKPQHRDGAWRAVGIHHQWPVTRPGEVVLRGTVSGVPEWRVKDKHWGLYYLYVDYGIESFFVPEGEGKTLEQLPNDAEVLVRVAVDRRGKAGILGILIDGKEYAHESLF